jgi:uncharacterized protein (DUF3820 family)
MDSDYPFGIFQHFFVLLAIVLCVLLWFMDSDYPFGIFQHFFVLLTIVLCVLLWFMDSDYPFGIFQHFFVLLTIIHKSKKDRQHNGQKDKEVLEDTKEVIRIHKS